MAKVNIVIPQYNNWEMTHNLLWSLYRKERENIHGILLVDDCSTEESLQEGVDWWVKEKLLPIKSISTPDNLGFLRASNFGFSLVQTLYSPRVFPADTDIVILLSTDVQVNGKFITQVQALLSSNPKSLVGGVLYSHDTGWNRFGTRIVPYLEGWLLATTVKNWETLEFFDPRYSRNDFEDVDLSMTAISKKFELIPLNNPGLVHLGGKSIGYNAEREKLTNINKKKFEEKWITKSSE